MSNLRNAALITLLVLTSCAPKEEAAPQDADAEIAQLKEAVAADTMRWQAHVNLSAALRRKERYDEAAQAASKAFMIAPSPGTDARLEMAKVFAASERSASAINVVKEVEKKKREGEPADEVKIAEVYAVLDDPNSVFRWLERAVTANSPNLATLKTNPDFNKMHEDPRWQQITSKIP